jgi:N6-L-threonylcarbamoyladenine synthase
MKILAIETSCDETAMAVVEAKGGLTRPRFKVLKNIVSSQIEVHRPYGGVFPTLAKREHIKNLPVVFEDLKLSEKNIEKIDAIAVTVGPGLEPALWTGITFAKELAKKLDKPLIGANHLEGHLYSPLLSLGEKDPNVKLPAIGLVVSGGHTILLKLNKIDDWKKIGETRDDAVGEAYDKVARMLGMPYPGGPEIERESKKGNAGAIEFPRPMIHHKNYDFSFSGLKTAVMYYTRGKRLTAKAKADIAASFQAAAVDVLVTKTMRAVEEHKAKSILLGGGVAANSLLRETLRAEAKKAGIEFYVSEMKYSGDNAAMIAASAYIDKVKGKKFRITAQANLNL